MCCGYLRAADPQEPQPFIATTEARPISDADGTTTSALRWQAKPQATASDYYASEASAQPIEQSAQRPLRTGWNITRIDPAVRQAQHVAPDPFSDPFGDRAKAAGTLRVPSQPSNGTRSVPTTGPELLLQPTQAESGIEELPAPRTMSPVRRASPMLTASQPREPESGVPPLGAPPSQQSTVPCDRVYNDRNCCDLEINCQNFRSRLLADSIRNISLDITPRYNPDLTPEADEQDRLDRLRLLETREWRNRRGAVIATGKMIKVQNNAVILGDDDGRETGRLPISELGEDELCYVTAWWRLPAECPLGGLRTSERNWLATTYLYHASALCHKPLYFEEVQLERYGHTAGPFRQPFISGAHFVISLAALPYQMAISPPTECEYSLGYYRPGNCAPWMIPPVPLSLRGASAEVAAALGMAYLIP
jgi:hypothetical protein